MGTIGKTTHLEQRDHWGKVAIVQRPATRDIFQTLLQLFIGMVSAFIKSYNKK